VRLINDASVETEEVRNSFYFIFIFDSVGSVRVERINQAELFLFF
jgi:hypothetical protein